MCCPSCAIPNLDSKRKKTELGWKAYSTVLVNLLWLSTWIKVTSVDSVGAKPFHVPGTWWGFSEHVWRKMHIYVCLPTAKNRTYVLFVNEWRSFLFRRGMEKEMKWEGGREVEWVMWNGGEWREDTFVHTDMIRALVSLDPHFSTNVWLVGLSVDLS